MRAFRDKSTYKGQQFFSRAAGECEGLLSSSASDHADYEQGPEATHSVSDWHRRSFRNTFLMWLLARRLTVVETYKVGSSDLDMEAIIQPYFVSKRFFTLSNQNCRPCICVGIGRRCLASGVRNGPAMLTSANNPKACPVYTAAGTETRKWFGTFFPNKNNKFTITCYTPALFPRSVCRGFFCLEQKCPGLGSVMVSCISEIRARPRLFQPHKHRPHISR
jgi:hypothetical protein